MQANDSELKILKMFIFINKSIGMKPSQIAVQAAHIAHKITNKLMNNCFHEYPISQECKDYIMWNNNPITIIYRATSQQLELLKNMSTSCSFYDYGHLTVVGFYPTANDNIVAITKNYTLL
jgi:hypothetical protein